MATLPKLIAAGCLEEIEVPGVPKPYARRIYGFPHVIDWLRDVLPGLESQIDQSHLDQDMSPLEQVFVRLDDYVRGEPLDEYEKSHVMTPNEMGVWEIKTVDVRVFGWFCSRNHFIAANVDTKARCIDLPGLAAGYRDDTVRRRDALDLDEPKFVSGGYGYVL